jgi:hypothetical protein
MRRRNLVVVRAGGKSLHPHWLAGEGDRNWDLVVSYFGEDPELFKDADVTRIDGKGTKWQGLHELFTRHRELVANYEYILLPDDDLMASKVDFNHLFDICGARGLEVCQPALTWNSFYSHLITLRNTSTRLRYTNYVETMTPCLSRPILQKSICYFDKTLSGWGLEWAWAKLAGTMKLAIVDEVAVRHTRPIGGPNYEALREKKISPWDEMRDLCRHLSLEPVIETYGAILADGRRIDRTPTNGRRFDLKMLGGCLFALKETPNRQKFVRNMGRCTLEAIRQVPHVVFERGSISWH